MDGMFGELGEFGSVFSDALKATAGALLLSLLAPLRNIFDRKQRRANARWELDTLRTMLEVEKSFADPNSERIAEYENHFDRVIKKYSDLQELHDPESSFTGIPDPGPFNYVDIIAALFVPIVTGILILGEAMVHEEGEIIVFMIGSSVISLLAARFLVWRNFRGGLTQTILQIICSILSLFPGLIISLIIFEELL